MSERELRLVELPEQDGQTLAEVKIPQVYFNKIRTGDKIIDEVFGGLDMPGIMPGSTTLLTGAPGAGKSTLALQLADMVREQASKNVLYNLGEENRFMAKMRSDRLKLSGDFKISNLREANELVEFILENRFEFVIQDSLQSLNFDGQTGHNALVSMANLFQDVSKEHGVTFIIVGQCTKSGNFAGPNNIKHDLDGHLHFSLRPDSIRVLEFMTKNRFGPSSVPFEFEMTPTGIRPLAPGATPAAPASAASPVSKSLPPPLPRGGRKNEEKERVRNLAKDLLLNGEALSAYCQVRVGAGCDGRFWRSRLDEAAAELQSQGYEIKKRTFEGRGHYYVSRFKEGA